MAAALAGVNAITEDKIAAAMAEKTQKAIAEVVPGDDAREIRFTDGSGLVHAVYQTSGGYAVQVAPSGFDGEITMMVGVDYTGKLLGISIISHTETPSLGAVAAEDNAAGEAFRSQFAGLSGTLAVTKDGGTVDAIDTAGKLMVKASMFALPLVFIVAGYIIYLKKYKISEIFYREILHDLQKREKV